MSVKFEVSFESLFERLVDYTAWRRYNPTWTGLFANLKGRGGGAKWPPPNLAISSQITMKLGRDILWVEIFAN